MGTKTSAALVAAVLALPGAAGAVKVGESLYVKAKNTRVMESPAPTANAVVILQPGEKVTWEGADPKQKQWHRVTATNGKKGFVFQTNLSTTPPNMELVTDKDGKQQLDPKKFVASGAAVKALSPGALEYGKEKQGDYAKAAEAIQALEARSKKVTTTEIAAHVKEAGLFPVVGPRDAVAIATPAKAPATGKKGGK
ncbi:SH3 domain-containing protein [Pyxidicoccus fallax]|uniref:SH3 domain-containing protein n=1 Tax=Pyxidicoccus fallax TaxID=394095 RepID=A0A848LZ69_9BACT|nr:SH3 domain-containing protein [Pyxidicoccus fallax]NMO22921.1 SH3 domain-containing protein [Pyxidicoccus fallax]NPC85888.1 SH3 domain-containing protein [Pyxidicoccus fallax]